MLCTLLHLSCTDSFKYISQKRQTVRVRGLTPHQGKAFKSPESINKGNYSPAAYERR